jgi:hypothetical protein
MSTIFIVILGFGLFCFGIIVGFYLKRIVFKNSDFDGTITVLVEDDKLLYSLELDSNPELLMFKDEVIFKVETPEQKTKVAE